MPSGIMQSCSRCRMQKRKCDRRLPICTLCERLKRPCSYPTFDEPPAVVPDPRELSCPTIRDTLHKQISAFVGNSQQVADWTAEYFRTIHLWLPVLSQTNFYTRLQSVQPETDSMDFSALILAMNLVCSKSVNAALTTPTRALYLLVKTLVSTLEADGVNSLEMVQARLLVTVFELGHGLYPAAYISAGANVRAAVDLGVNAGSDEQLVETFGSREIVEEAQKVWSGIIIADRYTTLCCAKPPFQSIELLTENAHVRAYVAPRAPLSPKMPAARQDTTPTPTDSLHSLLQSSNYLSRVLAHTHAASTPNHALHTDEALQILKVMTAFLVERDSGAAHNDLVSNADVAVCRSAMLEILTYGSRLRVSSIEHCSVAALDMLRAVVEEIIRAATFALHDVSSNMVDTVPVFVPHCLYKAAMVGLQAPRQPGQGDAETAVRPLVGLLRAMGSRWLAAGKYVKEIERSMDVDTTLTG